MKGIDMEKGKYRQFIKIKGVSEQKYRQFGEEFLETVKSAMLSAEQAENVAAAAGQVDSAEKKQAVDSLKEDSS